MVRYRKTWWGLTSLLIWDNSAFGRCLPFTLLALVESALLHLYFSEWDMVEEVREGWLHPYPFQAFAAIVGFFTVFRCDLKALRRRAMQHVTYGERCCATKRYTCPPKIALSRINALPGCIQRPTLSVMCLCYAVHRNRPRLPAQEHH